MSFTCVRKFESLYLEVGRVAAVVEPDETHPPVHPGLQAREVTITVMKLISKCDALQCCLERGQ